VRRALWRTALLYWMSYSAKAEYPVRCGLSIHHRRLWDTGSPAFADDDSWKCGAPSSMNALSIFKQRSRCESAISRRDAPELCKAMSLKKRRAQGMPGARCTRSLACEIK
jgi:hypothetical protein